ncbi:vegetative incompatibility het-e-1 [Trichoderma arundinaceum]|uniref:Vegetative incompatibility het-e-1 n=1 Tax=Trichoderma arundinaceum TaxID=490622 RepID=A0A395P1G0_TRIAR|nr:vegetative incompatibility het-e-1 [Trichoderma arundinaceum]
MDPFSSLNLARSTIQLIDFASKLVSGAYEIYHSPDGHTREDAELGDRTAILRKVASSITNRPSSHVADESKANLDKRNTVHNCGDEDTGVSVHIETVQGDEPRQATIQFPGREGDRSTRFGNKLEIEQAHERLQKLTSEVKSQSKKFDSGKIQRSRQEQDLKMVVMRCDGIANELQTTLSQLRVDPRNTRYRRFVSFRQAFIKICKKEKIVGMERTLDKYRADLTLQLAAIMSKGKDEGETSSPVSMHKSHELYTGEAKTQKSHPIEKENPQASQHLTDMLLSLVSTATDVAVAQKVLSGLHYGAMTVRMESVAKAYSDTYEWIFERQVTMDGSNIKVYFSEWLTNREGIFWVSGKPGSGKSTLMKFLCDHHRTREALGDWAKNLNWVMSTHFFWSSGTLMQKSQEGLLRSLLYDVFKKSPQIIKIVCPQRWEACKRGEGSLEPWTLSELRQALTSLGTCHELEYKYCFFIDGLDEYEGDHSENIAMLHSLATSPHIKLCVSSRPWNVFEDAYGKSAERKLYLQDLTKQDIRHYVQKKLEEHSNWQILPSEQPLYQTLLWKVTTKAQGVFLWVYLVVRSLHEGLRDGDSLHALERRTHELPADPEPFFKHMLNSVDSFYHVQMARTFQVAMNSTKPLPALIYSFLDEDYENQNFALHMPVKQMTFPDLQHRQEQLRRQLNGRCRGLLEICKISDEGEYTGHRVDFLHRTVGDFLRTKEMSDFLADKAGSYGGINTLVFKCFIPLIKSIPREELDISEGGSLSSMLGDAIHYAFKAELESGESRIELLDDLHRTLKDHSKLTGEPIPWYKGCYTASGAVAGYASYAPCQTFLEFTIQNGLCLYVKNQLRRKGRTFDATQPLLHCAIAHLPKYTIEEPDLTDMVRLLLNEKQIPASELLNGQAWDRLITWFNAEMLTFHSDPLRSYDKAKHRHGIIEVLLAHGVDPDTRPRCFPPAWHDLLQISIKYPLPPSVCAIMVQIFQSIIRASASLSRNPWNSWSATTAVLFDEIELCMVDNDPARLDFLIQICCLLVSHGAKLTESQRDIVEQRLPSRVARSMFTGPDQQQRQQPRILNKAKRVRWLGKLSMDVMALFDMNIMAV